eukprot:492282_1
MADELHFRFCQPTKPTNGNTSFSQTQTYTYAVPLQVHHHRRHRRRQVVPPPAVHRQALSASARPHHRRRVWSAARHNRRKANQTADLGHRGTGELPQHHTKLLPGCGGCVARIRHHAERNLPPPRKLARGCQAARQRKHDHHAHRKQKRPHTPAPGLDGGGRSVRQRTRTGVHGDERKDGAQRRGCVHQHCAKDT